MADNTAGTPAAPQQGARQDNIQKDQQGGEIRKNNRNHRRRHSGQRQRQGDENRQRQPGEKGAKDVRQPKERPEGREIRPARDQGQKRRRPVDGGSRDQQVKREKRQRFTEDEREKEPTLKKVETVDDIRSDNARITKEIYQVIASMKDITIE